MKPSASPQKPASHAEQALITGILEREFPPGSALPAERDLALRLSVTRPTLREVMGRLERDGWFTIRQGKSTIVNDIWSSGGLNVVSGIVKHARVLPPEFVPHLLELRLLMSPFYARAAVERAAPEVSAFLSGHAKLPDTARAFASFDWRLHHLLTTASGNPIFTLILNGFSGFYERMARVYFRRAEARDASRTFYAALLKSAKRGDGPAAERVTRRVMAASLQLWRAASAPPEAPARKKPRGTKPKARRGGKP